MRTFKRWILSLTATFIYYFMGVVVCDMEVSYFNFTVILLLVQISVDINFGKEKGNG